MSIAPTGLAARFATGRLASAALLALMAAGPAAALDYGPFTLSGFAKAELGRSSNQCGDCQRFPTEDRQRLWADQLVVGAPYGTETKHVTLFQPYLGVKFDLGRGFKLSGLLSQRWRDGKIDIPGNVYEENIALSHEDWGSVRIGKFVTRAWSIADYPYGSNVGLADEWGASGAGYGLNTRAIRYTSRTLDVLDGDLVLESTYDRGNTAFKIHKPHFVELYAQYHRGDLVVDAMYQTSRNGQAQAWGHGPFSGPTTNAGDDGKIGGSGQSIAMVMARWQATSAWEVSGGLRHNRWSGANAYITTPGTAALWNNMFNVDWNGVRNGVANPGYAATSTDAYAGLRWKFAPGWTASAATEVLGKATTDNPSNRGAANWASFHTAGVSYELRPGLQVYGNAGLVHYGHLGLAPLSMPSNSAFTGVDARVTRNGNWGLVGAVYIF